MKSQLYLIWGKEAFLIDQEINRITRQLGQEMGEEAEILYLDSDELPPRELREQLEFSPLFTMHRVAVIKRPYWLGKGRKRGNKSEEYIKAVNDYLDGAGPGQILILTTPELEKTNPLIKRLHKEAQIIECNTLDKKVLGQWIGEQFKQRGRTCTSQVVKRLQSSGQDMYYLFNLIEKLSLQVEGRAIAPQDLEQELDVQDEIKVFRLTDALLRRDLTGSIESFHQLLEQGEHPLLFLNLTLRQLANMARVKAYSEKGFSHKQIADITSMRDFMIRKFIDSGRHFSWEEIRRFLAGCLDIDLKIKNTSQDAAFLMESFIIEVCSRSPKNLQN